jgi:antitoxin PrlF
VAALLEEIGAITAKGQTTAPKSVRQALGVDYGGRITFRVDSATPKR